MLAVCVVLNLAVCAVLNLAVCAVLSLVICAALNLLEVLRGRRAEVERRVGQDPRLMLYT